MAALLVRQPEQILMLFWSEYIVYLGICPMMFLHWLCFVTNAFYCHLIDSNMLKLPSQMPSLAMLVKRNLHLWIQNWTDPYWAMLHPATVLCKIRPVVLGNPVNRQTNCTEYQTFLVEVKNIYIFLITLHFIIPTLNLNIDKHSGLCYTRVVPMNMGT